MASRTGPVSSDDEEVWDSKAFMVAESWDKGIKDEQGMTRDELLPSGHG